MYADPVLTYICDHLITGHQAHTVLLYGSRADGSATADSDYDVMAFAPVERVIRDARYHEGDYLDIFIYPEQMLAEPSEALLHLRSAQILRQRGTEAEAFLAHLDALFKHGPAPLPPDEVRARMAWIPKMLTRMQRGDAEGNYRRAWLLFQLLEDYFHLRQRWYLGPKRSLALLEREDPGVYAKFSAALEPGASRKSIEALAAAVMNGVDA